MRQANRIDTLARLKELRRLRPRPEANGACHRAKEPQNQESAEGRILEIAEVAYVLQADGFPKPEIFKRIGSVYGTDGTAPPTLDHLYPLRDYLIQHLRTHEPQYLELGGTLFTTALLVASLWAEIFAARLTASNWPPQGMLSEPWAISGYAAIMRKKGDPDARPTFTRSLADLDVLLGEYRYDPATGVRRMKARAIPGDVLHGFSTGPESWTARMGSSGIALVRDGRSIDHVVTLMN